MKIDALDHPKTIELSSQLGVCLPQAIGHLELLWAFVAQKTPRGNIGRWSDAVIAHAAQWTGDPSEFVGALIESGLLDEDEEHRILIHDWADHCPNWVRAKLKKEGKVFLSSDLSTDLSKNLRKDLTGHYKPSQAKGGEAKPREGVKREQSETENPDPTENPPPPDFNPKDYSKWKPDTETVQAIKQGCPKTAAGEGATDEFIEGCLPEFRVYARDNYTPSKLAARFIKSVTHDFKRKQLQKSRGASSKPQSSTAEYMLRGAK